MDMRVFSVYVCVWLFVGVCMLQCKTNLIYC